MRSSSRGRPFSEFGAEAFRPPDREYRRTVCSSSPGRTAGCLSLLFCLTGMLLGHEIPGRETREDVHLQIGPRNMDVDVLVTFFSQSHAAAGVHDRNGDGVLDEGETREWAKQLSQGVASQLELAIDGRVLPLLPLHNPELELSSSRSQEAHPLRLRLSLFARTPEWLRPGSLLTIERQAAGGASETGFRLEGHGGFRFDEGGKGAAGLMDPAGSMRFSSRCSAVPNGSRAASPALRIRTDQIDRTDLLLLLCLLAPGLLLLGRNPFLKRREDRSPRKGP